MRCLFPPGFFSSNIKLAIAPLLIIVTLLTAYLSNPYFFKLNVSRYSLHDGIRYYSRLRLWHYFVDRNNWVQADLLARTLNPLDTAYVTSQLHPSIIGKRLNELNSFPSKTANDYLKIAQLQTRLGQADKALKTLESALRVDPLRDDIRSLYRQLTTQ